MEVVVENVEGDSTSDISEEVPPGVDAHPDADMVQTHQVQANQEVVTRDVPVQQAPEQLQQQVEQVQDHESGGDQEQVMNGD